jgi:hypothetical protein
MTADMQTSEHDGAASPRWRQRPDGSNWGDFGPDDQLGRLNLLTPKTVLQGIAEAKEGIVFCLSLPLDYPGGAVLSAHRHPPVLRPTFRNGQPNMNRRVGGDAGNPTDVVSDDVAIIHLQYSTLWDSFAHNGQLFDADADGVPEGVYYNGYRAGVDIVGPTDPADAGATGTFTAKTTTMVRALGIENMAATGVQGRGVMIDLHAHFGRTHKAVGYDDLMRIIEADRVEVESGDMVCLHTGYSSFILEMGRDPDPQLVHTTCAGLAGSDQKLLNWITDSGLSVLISDNMAVEYWPAPPPQTRGPGSPLHAHCLFKQGIHLGELFHLSPLAEWLRARGRYRFLLTAPPLRLPGAVGSPATPVATV